MPYKNKSDQYAGMRRHYDANKESIKAKAAEKNKRHKALVKQMLFDYQSEHPCVDCGEPDPIVLEFDHVTGTKEFNLSSAGSLGIPVRRIVEEIAKCEVRCANCHRRVTHQRRVISSVGRAGDS